MEIDMESAYVFLEKSNQKSFWIASVAILVAVILFVCVYMSMRKQKKKDQEQQSLLAETAAAAEAANEAKSTFLFNMSHDIRTPMNAIIGYAELARERLDDKQKMRGYIENIQICGKKLLSIIDNVLELAKIENNEMNLEESVSKVEDLLDSGVAIFHRLIEEKHQTFTINREITYPYVYMDQAYVSEILLNIISNAIKYTGDGGKISCSLTQQPYEKKAGA